ncbi:MAG: hypothetical protein M3Z17_10320, partial [Gemmatimonadota bacterium]|nr:hypothetical protein [Gemmatimonadota bacterium]
MFVVDGVTSIIAGIILTMATWTPYSADANADATEVEQGWIAERVLTPRFLIFLAGVVLSGIVFFQH